MLRLVRFVSSRVDASDVARAFTPEINKIEFHSALVNQTNWRDLHALKDVTPMMQTLYFLMKNRAVTGNTALHCTRALSRSAKDAPVMFRHLLDDERAQVQATTYDSIARYCGEIAQGIIDKEIPAYLPAVGSLLNAYEIVDPVKGAAFYIEANLLKAGGSAIPCLVKSGAPLSTVEEAYAKVPNKVPRVRSAMLWAYLKYGEVDKALEMKQQIQQDAPLSVLEYVNSVFVGDAPLEVAREHFWAAELLPHHSAVCRLLSAAWAANGSVSEQLAIFERYLELARGHSEATIKPVVYRVTDNIVQPSAAHDGLKLKTMATNIKNLVGIYSKLPEQSLFLNILLTCVSKYWPDKESLIMPILNAFSADNSSKITYRVRLNALRKINPDNRDKLIKSLWAARCSLRDPLQVHDWLSLYKTAPHLAQKIYQGSTKEQRQVAEALVVSGRERPFNNP